MSSTAESVITIDCHYLEPEHAAAYLLIEHGRAAFIDNNTVHAVPRLLQALEDRGLRPEDVAYAIVTHLHLDHGGGTSALVERCPHATVIAHPRAVRHLVDPARLIAGVKAVYGEAEFDRLYAPIHSIDPARIRGVEDGETLAFGDRVLTFLHTRGHANHHICIHDEKSNGVFTGDMFGVAYNARRPTRRPFLLCSTAPTEFDPAEARASIRTILNTGADRVFLAHYGELRAVREGAEVILSAIDQMEAILHEAVASKLTGEALQRFCEGRMRAAIEDHIGWCGVVIEERDWPSIERGIRIDAQGLAYLAEKDIMPRIRTP
jgi:glyoxylase-like metal-dependent hydrolase (beta-lactamase superfamily II)